MAGGRPSGAKTRCSGQWTEARFRSFIISALRGASRKWAPMQQALKAASTRRGFFKCQGCGEECPTSVVIDGKRYKNKLADHIEPIVDPAKGFENWDTFVERMFIEREGWQILCKACHDEKTAEERAIAVERRREEKINGEA